MIVACEDDDPVAVVPDSDFQNLTTRGAVLNNIEVANNKRNLVKYEELLDDNFTFFLAAGDVGGGLPPSWARADEVALHTNLFDPNFDSPRCTGIEMNLVLENGVIWAEITTPPSAPSETWYTTTVFYNFKFLVEPDTQYISLPASKAQFTVRNAGTEDAPRWQLVEMHDLSDESSFAENSAVVTEQSTWGQVKAIFR